MNVCTGERSWTDRIAQLSGNGALACLLGLAAVRVWIQCILFDSYVQADDGIFTIINNFAYGAAILTGALVALRRPPGARMQSRLGWIAFVLMIVAPLGLLAIPGSLRWVKWLALAWLQALLEEWARGFGLPCTLVLACSRLCCSAFLRLPWGRLAGLQ